MIERSKFEHQFFNLRGIILDGVSYFIVWQGLAKEYEVQLKISVNAPDSGGDIEDFLHLHAKHCCGTHSCNYPRPLIRTLETLA